MVRQNIKREKSEGNKWREREKRKKVREINGDILWEREREREHKEEIQKDRIRGGRERNE